MKKVRKLLAKIHLLLGLFSGFIVFIIGITGSIWVFHKEITAFFNPIELIPEHPNNNICLQKNWFQGQRLSSMISLGHRA
ncbi:MAG: PepSY domain-containing protein [Croceivirga sp.]